MSVLQMEVALVASRRGPEKPSYEEYIVPLCSDSSDGYEKFGAEEGVRSTAIVQFAFIKIGDFPESTENFEMFVDESRKQFNEIAAWLDLRPLSAFEKFSRDGIETILLINEWIDSNQLDLFLPPRLLGACARLGIEIQILTNE